MKNYLPQINISNSAWKTIALGFILSAVFFVLLTTVSVGYKSTVSVMISPKSEVAAISHDKILNNIVAIGKSMTFYQRLLLTNEDIRENKKFKSDTDRIKAWNEMVKIQRYPKNSSIIKVAVLSPKESDSQKIAFKTTRALLDTASMYYNAKTDVDMRIIEGPITQTYLKSVWVLLITSVLLGFLTTFLLEKTIDSLFQSLLTVGQIGRRKIKVTLNKLKEKKVSDKTQDKQEEQMQEIKPETEAELSESRNEEELERLNKIIQQDIYPNFPEMPVETKKASAPDNLPIADEIFFSDMPESDAEMKVEENKEEKIEEDLNREPTPEEIKKRLNQLLRGK